MVDAPGAADRTATTPQRKSEMLLAGGWLNAWHEKFQAIPGPWQRPIQKAWTHWQECVKLAGHCKGCVWPQPDAQSSIYYNIQDSQEILKYP